jgi:hypothetical protein
MTELVCTWETKCGYRTCVQIPILPIATGQGAPGVLSGGPTPPGGLSEASFLFFFFFLWSTGKKSKSSYRYTGAAANSVMREKGTTVGERAPLY